MASLKQCNFTYPNQMIDLYLLSEERKYKGGDPAAPSGTATLLRLHPNHQSQLRTQTTWILLLQLTFVV